MRENGKDRESLEDRLEAMDEKARKALTLAPFEVATAWSGVSDERRKRKRKN